ncbi:N-carbamoylputrescine amidase [Mesorhizobium sp. CU2]|uniref:N-carbamoylputrescine amidase n=1 Tax=unclassified Mesorhizobium TaxID=325217 RepID=UPI00112648CF|nr:MULTISPECIES: N-carbamoylputrescine amidase [unclassified Mesorhizobium]TPN88503.1 N-carbamoylputrescine amidase [Mesorhizobium sp. CU3]TPO08183.1 N-carbamoylputrescine amidase [Mesorhizobium sp. CU2]
MRQLIAAAVQISCTDQVEENLDKIEGHVREAASRGAGLVVLQELFEGVYFCMDEDRRHNARALPLDGHPTIARMSALAHETGAVLPVSLFERDGSRLYNTLVMIDADGKVLGRYRKSHIPNSPGYSEKLYFADGDTGFRVFETAVGKVGAGVCWDQWFPEAARAMVLMGAELLVYPTAIGSEPSYKGWDSRDHWQRVMQGHAGANLTPVIAANRIGTESGAANEITFYGSSFIADHTGAKLAEADRVSDSVITAALDLDAIAAARSSWGVFRDRRPDLYGVLLEPTPGRLLAKKAA